jgi:hypothetical protein
MNKARICKPLKELLGIDSQPGGPVRQPYLTYRPARLHRLAESIPWNPILNVYKYGLRYTRRKKVDKTAEQVRYLGDSHKLLDKALVLYVPEVNPLVGNVQQGEPVRL